MKKITLNLDDLKVESFNTTPEATGRGKGAVFGYDCGCPPGCNCTCPDTCVNTCPACDTLTDCPDYFSCLGLTCTNTEAPDPCCH